MSEYLVVHPGPLVLDPCRLGCARYIHRATEFHADCGCIFINNILYPYCTIAPLASAKNIILYAYMCLLLLGLGANHGYRHPVTTVSSQTTHNLVLNRSPRLSREPGTKCRQPSSETNTF